MGHKEKENPLGKHEREVDKKKHKDDCISTIKKRIRVAAEVSVTPHICIIDDKVHIDCSDVKAVHKTNGTKNKYSINRKNRDTCTFVFHQDLEVKIPLRIEVDVDAKALGVDCNPHKKHNDYDDDCHCDDAEVDSPYSDN